MQHNNKIIFACKDKVDETRKMSVNKIFLVGFSKMYY